MKENERLPGLNGKQILGDILSEGKRLMTQGASELASALFNGGAFVPYGQGQWRGPAKDGEKAGVYGPEVTPDKSMDGQQKERGGRSM